MNKVGALVSVFDGRETYSLNKWTLAKHGGVLLAFSAFAFLSSPLQYAADQTCAG